MSCFLTFFFFVFFFFKLVRSAFGGFAPAFFSFLLFVLFGGFPRSRLAICFLETLALLQREGRVVSCAGCCCVGDRPDSLQQHLPATMFAGQHNSRTADAAAMVCLVALLVCAPACQAQTGAVDDGTSSGPSGAYSVVNGGASNTVRPVL